MLASTHSKGHALPTIRAWPLLFAIVLAAIAFLLGLTLAFAQEFPKPVGFVNDFAGVIPDDTESQLETLLQQFEQDTTVEIAVVTVPSLNGDTIEGYAVRLFQQWGIGKKGVDNGVLLLVTVAERDVRIEIGYGMEPYITDGQAGQILDTRVIPDLKQGNYALGILKGAQGIEQVIQASDYVPGTVRPPASNPLSEAFQGKLWILIVLAGISMYLFSFFARSKAVWPGGIWGAITGGVIGWVIGGALAIILGSLIAWFVGVLLDAMLSSAYRNQVSGGKPTGWHQSWGGFSGMGGLGGWGGGGGGGFGGFGGGRSGGGGASRGF